MEEDNAALKEKLKRMKELEKENLEKRNDYRRAAIAKEKRSKREEESKSVFAAKEDGIANRRFETERYPRLKKTFSPSTKGGKRNRSKESFAMPESEIQIVETDVAALTARKKKLDEHVLNLPIYCKTLSEKRKKAQLEDELMQVEKALSQKKLVLRNLKLEKRNRIARVA